MRVLITGINGFTGRHLAAELAGVGCEVWGMGTHDEADIARYRRADLGNADRLREIVAEVRPEAVVHLAGIAFVGHGAPRDFYEVNLIGTRNLLAALAALPTPPTRILLASSANVYGNATEGMLTETMPANPANDYAVSKLAMEYMARLWTDKLPIITARPFNYTGPGQALSFVMPKLVDHFARRASSIDLGNLHVAREFNDIRMVCGAYRGLLERGVAGEVYNVCSGRPYPLEYVIGALTELTGHQIDVRVNPAFVRANEVHRLCGNPAKLIGTIGELPQIPLHATLEWMLRQAAGGQC